MKTLSITLSVIALGLIIFNLTKVNFSAPFEGESTVALITIFAGLCVIVMMAILRTSKRIEDQVKKQK